jgi:hypothetical protein
MVSPDVYAAGLDAVVADQKTYLDNTTEESRFLAFIYSSKCAMTFDDLAGMLAVAVERLANHE